MNIGAHLKEKRKESGFTQEKLAELAEVDERTIRRIENNEMSVGMKTLKKIYDVLGITTSDRKLFSSMLKYDNNHLNPIGILNKLGNNNPQELLKKLEENLLKAFNFAKAENYQEALDIYLAFAKLYPTEYVFLGCASMYQMTGKYEKAIEYSDKILLMEASQDDALSIKGVCLGELKKYDNAIEVLNNALLINNTFETHYNLAYIYWMSHNNLNAIKHYKECLELNPDFAPAHLNLGICYFDIINLEESLYHFDQAIRLEPDMYQAYGRKGEYYRFIEEHDQAIKYFEKCLKLDNKNYQALLGISISLAVKGNISESILYFEKFFESHLDNMINVNKSSRQRIFIVDIGYEIVRLIEVEYETESLINVNINGLCFQVSINKSKSIIFIGSEMMTDKTGSILYPIVGKTFQDKAEFNEVITKIQESVELFRFFEKPLYIDVNGNIKVNIIERENNVLIEMVFGEKYHIIGITDTKSGGLESFVQHYEKNKQFRIHLECATELFIIDCLKDVSVILLSNQSYQPS